MNRTTIVRWIAGGALAGSLVVGGMSIQGVFAQSPTITPQTPATSTSTPAQPGLRDAPWNGDPGKMWGRRGPGRHLNLVQATADVTGLTTEAILTELRAGSSPAQVAQANGKTAADVVNALVAQVKTELDQAVAAGRLTQEQADQQLAQATRHAQQHVNQTGLDSDKGDFQRGNLELLRATASVSGLTVQQVRTELAAGKSLAQVVQAQGKTVDDVINTLRTAGEARLTQLLDQARTRMNTPGGR